MNPAGLVVLPRYGGEIHYELDLVREEHQVDVSVVDSKTSMIAAGIGYTFDGQQFTKRASLQHTATLALAYPFFNKMLNVGVGLKYVNVSDAFLGNYLNALAADLGVLSRLPFGVSFGAVGYNLLQFQNSSQYQSGRVPLSAGFGASMDFGPLSALVFGGTPAQGMVTNVAGVATPSTGEPLGPLSGLSIEGDWHMRFLTLYGIQSRLSVGMEYLLFNLVPLRAGYMFQQEDEDHRVSVGAGFVVPSFGLDVAYQQSVVIPDERVFGCSLKIFLNM